MNTRALVLLTAFALVACADTPTQLEGDVLRTGSYLVELGERVPGAVVEAEADAVEACTGTTLDLDGWSFWIAADVRTACSGGRGFPCPEGVDPGCPALPPGRTEAECPCLCTGLEYRDERVVVVADDYAALGHELIHAGYGIEGHAGNEELWRCQ